MIWSVCGFGIAFTQPSTFHEAAQTALLQSNDAAEVAGPNLALGTEFRVGVAAAVGRPGRIPAHLIVGVIKAGVGGGGGGGAGVAHGVFAVAVYAGVAAVPAAEDVGVDAKGDAA